MSGKEGENLCIKSSVCVCVNKKKVEYVKVIEIHGMVNKEMEFYVGKR